MSKSKKQKITNKVDDQKTVVKGEGFGSNRIALFLSMINTLILIIQIPFLSPIIYESFQKPKIKLTGIMRNEFNNNVTTIIEVKNDGRAAATNLEIRFLCLDTDEIEVLNASGDFTIEKKGHNLFQKKPFQAQEASIKFRRFAKNAFFLIKFLSVKEHLESVRSIPILGPNSEKTDIQKMFDFPKINKVFCEELGDILD